ncbi:MAG: ATP-binding protein [Cyanobacteriota bacterium]|nr:ATP-binding protein [Cyanobacteriota bacterium]
MVQPRLTESSSPQPLADLARLLKVVKNAPTVNQAITPILQYLHQAFGFQVVWLGRYNSAARWIEIKPGWGWPQSGVLDQVLPLTPGDLMEQAVLRRQPLVVADLAQEPRAGELGVMAKRWGLQSALVYPLNRQDRCLGVLGLGSPHWGGGIGPQQRSHLAILTHLLTQLLHQDQREQQQCQAKQTAPPLLSLLGQLGQLPNLEAQLQSVARAIQDFIGPTHSRIFWYEPEGQYFCQRYPDPLGPPSSQHRAPRIPAHQLSRLEQVLRHQPVVVESPSAVQASMAEPLLRQTQAQALMVAAIIPQGELKGFICVEDGAPRLWQAAEKEFLKGAGQLLALLSTPGQPAPKVLEPTRACPPPALDPPLQSLAPEGDGDQLERAALSYLQDQLGATLVGLITWNTGDLEARVTQLSPGTIQAWINQSLPISLARDPLLNSALQSPGPIVLAAADLPQDGDTWLRLPGQGQVILAALRTHPHHAVTAIVVALATGPLQDWGTGSVGRFQAIADQLAWARRQGQLIDHRQQHCQQLQRLNWYKQQYLQVSHRELQRLAAASAPSGGPRSPLEEPLVDQMAAVLEEDWQLRFRSQTMPLIRLLNRLVESIRPILEARQLWSQVHNDSRGSLVGDGAKLELVLHQVLVAAAQRSPSGGRLDIWCRVLRPDCLELSITDDGRLDTTLLHQLQQGPGDPLLPSPLDHPPGLNLWVCQQLLLDLGGELAFSLLPDGRTHSRFLLPLADASPS